MLRKVTTLGDVVGVGKIEVLQEIIPFVLVCSSLYTVSVFSTVCLFNLLNSVWFFFSIDPNLEL